jgi:hypothetical protein
MKNNFMDMINNLKVRLRFIKNKYLGESVNKKDYNVSPGSLTTFETNNHENKNNNSAESNH